jgi:predicted AAA+ superfamily ATPase
MINRIKDIEAIQGLLELFPVTGILGARQCGKTTLARHMRYDHYFDLENPLDISALENPQLVLEKLQGLVVIDEIQCKPDLFPLLRYLVDNRKDLKFLILGSASRDLIRQSSESLAGRIGYHYLGGLQLTDIGAENVDRLWMQGGFPRAYTAENLKQAQTWLDNYVTTFLERDIPQLGISIPAQTLRRFWMMLCHYHGQVMNYSEIAGSFGVSDHTIRRYLDILTGTFMVRTLEPWHVNIGKRLVKRPKIYLRDSGILHYLLSIRSMKDLVTHNKLGASWEGFALEAVAASLGKKTNELFFWKIHSGAEVDLYWQEHGKNWAIEFKFADAPGLTDSMKSAIELLELEHLWIVYPGDKSYPLHEKCSTFSIHHIEPEWNYSV